MPEQDASRDLDWARAQGKRDAQEEASRHDTAQRFAALDRQISNTVSELRGVKDRLTRMEGAMATGEAVERAVKAVAERSGAKHFTHLQALGIIITALVAIGVFTVSLAAALGH